MGQLQSRTAFALLDRHSLELRRIGCTAVEISALYAFGLNGCGVLVVAEREVDVQRNNIVQLAGYQFVFEYRQIGLAYLQHIRPYGRCARARHAQHVSRSAGFDKQSSALRRAGVAVKRQEIARTACGFADVNQERGIQTASLV